MLVKYICVALGGALGAMARFALGSFVGNRMGSQWPYGTFIINVSGSFAIGVIMTILAEHTHLSRNWLYLVPIGFIGGYTTFSTFEFETLRLIQDGQVIYAAMNVIVSVFAGFAMVWLGVVAGKMLP
jgi:CrcB protein